MPARIRWTNLLFIIVLVCSALGFSTQRASAAASDLFISEYIEGGSYNKVIEIYNGTGTAVDLTPYSLELYSNGSSTPSQSMALSGTLADGDVFIIANNKADEAVLAIADATSGSVINFNGDDAVALQKGEALVDVIGQIGFDPGSAWGSNPVTTLDHTLVRKSTVCSGDTDGSDAFDPAIEWDSYAKDTFTYLGAHTAVCGGTTITDPLINEFSIDTDGTDYEYIEFIGDAGTDYSAYTLLEIEGDSGTSLGVIDVALPLEFTDSNSLGFLKLDPNILENGTVSLLLVKGFTGAAGNDIDTLDAGAIDYAPWEELIDSVAVSDGGSGDLTYGIPVLSANYDGLAPKPGGASRIPDGYDTDAASDWVRNDFDLAGIVGYEGTISAGEAYNTPGEPNVKYEPAEETCGDPYTPVYDIQGSGASTPISGTELSTEGIVVGDYQVGGKSGFFIQDAAGDGNPATSDGVYIYAPGSVDVQIGDHVRVRGTATEYSGLTEVNSVSQIWICSMGAPLPTPAEVSLPVADMAAFEAFEGMRVVFPQDLVISEYFEFDRYGSIILTSTRHVNPTALYEPGSPEYYAAVDAYALDRIKLDDGRTSQNPDPALHPNGVIFDLDNLFRGGSLVTDLIGVMDYAYGEYTIQPSHGATYTDTNPRTTSPDLGGGDLKIASLNVLNYFTTIDTGADICGPAGDMECRGADTTTELTRQREKILNALIGLDADVVGLIEIENDRSGETPDYAVADLVNGLNAALSAGTYNYIATGAIGTDAIKVAMIYKTASVTPIGNYAIMDSSVNPLYIDTYNRPALAVTFKDDLSGEGFTVVVNHLKSKSSNCDAVGDPDLGDGAGNCNITRTNAAIAEVDWLATDPTNTGVENIVLIGDFNSYDKEDPIDAIKAGPDNILGTADDYLDMIFERQGENAYGYVYNGEVGYLDYALANSSFALSIVDVNVWHINADEPDLIDYDMTYKQDAQDAIFEPDAYRSSDHDPVVISIVFGSKDMDSYYFPIVLH